MNFIKTTIVSGVVALVVVLAVVNLPAQWFSYDYWFSSPKFGTAFTTLQSTDVL